MTKSRKFNAPRLGALCALIGAAIAIPLAATPASASPVILYVSTTGANSGNCQTSGSPCASISYAVSQAASGDTVQVAAGTYQDIVEIPGTITGLTIAGPSGGATVDGKTTTAQVGSVFALDDGANVTISNLTIADGEGVIISDPSPLAYGDGVFISQGAVATLTHDTVTENTDSRDGNDEGGGVYNAGTATLTDDTISNNTSTNEGGGGILTASGTNTTLTDDTIAGNIGLSAGGGLFNAGNTVLTDDTITGNTAAYTELGVDAGGGVYNDAGTIHVDADTIANNSAAGPGDSIATDGGSTTDVAGTIFGQPTTGDSLCDIVSGSPWNDDGYNISQDTTCGLSSATSLSSTVADLGALGANGGPTETMLPGSGSPVIDKIPDPTTADGFSLCPGTDQRGMIRPQGLKCDIGSVEVAESTAAPTISGTPSSPAATGVSYTYALTMGGNPVPTAAVTSGSLPPGLRLSPAGVISGTPTTAGVYSATVTASNGVSPDAADPFVITISPDAKIKKVEFKGSSTDPSIVVTGSGFGTSAPTPSYPPGPCPARGTGSLYQSTFYFTDNSGNWNAGQGGANGDGSCIGLVIVHWGKRKITFGFGNDYPGGGLWVLNAGDSYTVDLYNSSASGTVRYR